WTRAVAGPDAQVHGILAPNTDPHEYEPRPRDVTATAKARLVLENGDRLDAWMDKVVARAGGEPPGVLLRDRVPFCRHGAPPWWHDPRNAEAAVRQTRDALAAPDPAHKPGYDRRAAAYLARLRALDAELAGCYARIPPPDRKLVTNHDAFGYL